MADGAVDAVLQEADRTDIEIDEVVVAAATGAVEAAYQVSQSHGDRVRRSVVQRVLEPRLAVAPEIERQLSEVAERLSKELPKGQGAWRGKAMMRAARLLLRAGGIDLAASLAYFTILSLLPMVALVIMAAAVIGDPEGISDGLTDVLIYYFPSSHELIREAVENLLNGSLVIGLAAVVSIVVGANGLFMAANRSVNRVFGIEAVKFAQVTVTQAALVTLVVVLFLLSVGLTTFLHLVVSFGQGIAEVTGEVFGHRRSSGRDRFDDHSGGHDFGAVHRCLSTPAKRPRGMEGRHIRRDCSHCVVRNWQARVFLVYRTSHPEKRRLRAGCLCRCSDDVGIHCRRDISLRRGADQDGW